MRIKTRSEGKTDESSLHPRREGEAIGRSGWRNKKDNDRRGVKMEERKYIFWFEELTKEHAGLVGKKCKPWGDDPVGDECPPGFSLALFSMTKFLEDSGLGVRLARYIGDLRISKRWASSASGK
jgi:hypothetical protein